ncbi:MAG: MFS transporter [Deltaproteobacteria bacterium]|nr:MFS transporter [Deltaproteobacteria bacterium]
MQRTRADLNLKILLVLIASHLCVDLTGSSIPAIMPLFKSAFQLNYTQVGAAIMVSNLTSSIIQPCFGYFSDRAEIRWLLPISIILTYAGFGLTGLAPGYAALLALVILNGVGIALYHPESFKIAHFFTGSREAAGMSFFQVGGNLGMALGPLLVTFATQLSGLRGTVLYLVPALAMLLTLMLFWGQIGESAAHGRERRAGPAPAPTRNPGARPWKPMSLLIVAVALRSWAFLGIVTFAPFYYISFLHGDPITAGRLVFAFLLGGTAGTLAGGFIADRIGHKRLFASSMLCAVPLLFAVTYVSRGWVFPLLFVAGFVLISSFSVTVVMGQRILHDRLGMASGLMLGFVIGVGGLGAGLLGVVADAWGVLTVLRLIPLMPALGLIPILFVRYAEHEPERLVA